MGHLSRAELLIIMAELCMETPKQGSAAKCTKLLSTVLASPLYTHQQTHVSPLMPISDALNSSEAKTSVWTSTEAVTQHRR